VSLPVLSGPGGAHITKYRITKPAKDGVTYDDFLLSLPERDHLAAMSKEVPLFIRYLKAVTEKEGRKDDFSAFFERAKNGLSVESDVYINTDELLPSCGRMATQSRSAMLFSSLFHPITSFTTQNYLLCSILPKRTPTSSACELAWKTVTLVSSIMTR
jgi:hypothetical protein